MAKSNALGITTHQKKWTDLALHCYMRKCACTGCLYSCILESSKCQIKAAVLELIRTKNFPTYNVIEKEDGTTEYHIIGNHSEGRQRNRGKVYRKFKKHLTDEILCVIERINAGTQAKVIIGLFLAGLDKTKISTMTKKSRVNINDTLATIYSRTQAEVNYKTKHNKLEELIKYYGRQVHEQKNFDSNGYSISTPDEGQFK